MSSNNSNNCNNNNNNLLPDQALGRSLSYLLCLDEPDWIS